MQTLIVKTDQPQKMDLILAFLKQIEGIEVESVVENSVTENTSNQAGGLLSLVGIWEDRDIDSQTLRKEAWGRIGQ